MKGLVIAVVASVGLTGLVSKVVTSASMDSETSMTIVILCGLAIGTVCGAVCGRVFD